MLSIGGVDIFSRMSYRVFANHAHVFPEALNPKGTIERLLTLLDACQIDRAVCFAPLPPQCDGKGVDPNPWLAGELKKYKGRLIGFGTIDARRPDVREQVKKAADLGFRGLKLHPNAQEFDILSARMFDLFGTAQDLNLFISFHTGVHQSRLLQMSPLRFDEVAWNFPRLRFSMEHVGGYHFFHEALAVIFNHVPPPWVKDSVCNVYAGLTSIFTQHQNRFWYQSNERIKELAAQVGVRQFIFGLDFPYNLEKETEIAFQTIRSLFNEAEQEQILGGNLKRELGIE